MYVYIHACMYVRINVSMYVSTYVFTPNYVESYSMYKREPEFCAKISMIVNRDIAISRRGDQLIVYLSFFSAPW